MRSRFVTLYGTFAIAAILVIVTAPSEAAAQTQCPSTANIVKNPSFEQHNVNGCASTHKGMVSTIVKDWDRAYTGAGNNYPDPHHYADYFDIACPLFNGSVNASASPSDGSRHHGGWIGAGYAEYFQGSLSESLIPGRRYTLSFDIKGVHQNGYGNWIGHTIEMGADFSASPLLYPGNYTTSIPASSTIVRLDPITLPGNYVRITKEFTATNAAQYFVIGSFSGMGGTHAYVYTDNYSVTSVDGGQCPPPPHCSDSARFASSIVQYVAGAVTTIFPDKTTTTNGVPSYVLGAPDRRTADFDNNGSQPGFVIVSFSEPIIDGPGADLAIHLVDFLPSELEQFELLVSSDGNSFVSLGQQTPTAVNGIREPVTLRIDLAGRISSVRQVKILNASIVMSTPFYEGPDIDAIEALNSSCGQQQCSDGRDNDGDGKVDFPNDPGCSSTEDTDETNTTTTPQCRDGLDNDADGKADFPNDPGCANSEDNDETNTAQTGCIEVRKETFDVNGQPLTPVAQFTFKLDGTRTAMNSSDGLVRFDNVAPGTHTVTEDVPSSWTQISVTPVGGQVTVASGSACAGVIFKNRQSVGQGNNDLTITIEDTPDPAEPGETLTYRLRIKNVSADDRDDIEVLLILPEETEFVSASDAGEEDDNLVSWEDLSLDEGEEMTLTVKVTVDEDSDDGDTLHAIATAGDAEDEETTEVDEKGDTDEDKGFIVTKEANPTEVFPGGIIEYTLIIENETGETLTDLEIVDELQSGQTEVIDDGDAVELRGNRLTWEIDELEDGESETIRYSVRLLSSAYPGEVVRNHVRVTTDEGEGDEDDVTVFVIGDLPQTGGGFTTGSEYLSKVKATRAAPSTRNALPVALSLGVSGLAAGGLIGRRYFL